MSFLHDNQLACQSTVELWYREVLKDWQNEFILMGVRYFRALFHTFYYYWADEYGSLYQGLHFVGVCDIEVPL